MVIAVPVALAVTLGDSRAISAIGLDPAERRAAALGFLTWPPAPTPPGGEAPADAGMG